MKIIRVPDVESFAAKVFPKQPQKNKLIVESILKNVQKNGDSAFRKIRKKIQQIKSYYIKSNKTRNRFCLFWNDPFVSMILSPGQTGVMDRGYQAHDLFDRWQEENKHFVCCIKASTNKT